jgi:NAD(P)H-hydrate epimerase
MGELMNLEAAAVNEKRFEVAAGCARKYNAVVVLKGARTVVTAPGETLYVNLSGNPGMATGGAGDVLTGTIAGLLAQLKEPVPATRLAVYTHGRAGDIAARTHGNGLKAGDIADNLPAALLEIAAATPQTINPRLQRLD